jgi:type III restriction enzyme
MPHLDQQPLPIQPVEQPILCNPYNEPAEHWVYDTSTGEAQRMAGRRPASYWFKTQRVLTGQMMLTGFAEEEREDLPLVNALRADVKHWRALGHEGATEVSKELLRYWQQEDRTRRLFFCQLESAETAIYLNEILLSNKRTRFKSALDDMPERDKRLTLGQSLSKLLDHPADPAFSPLTRLGLKMATGSGKTVVMAMMIAWTFCNRGRVASDERFPSSVLVVCPNLTIKERLQVLRPENENNYYDEFDLLPGRLRPLLNKGKVMVTNWHLFAPESEHTEGGKSYTVVNKGPESPQAFAHRILSDLADNGPILVINDEAHHAWRPAYTEDLQKASKELKEELEEATVWIDGLDKLNLAVGVRGCLDFSATPFYIQGSGQIEGAPFPWLVSDFGLVDAIESGIVKIPRLPVSDTTGRPEPKYFRLWQHVIENLQPGERLPGRAGKPKPEVIYREVEPALLTLAGQWKERFEYIRQSSNESDKTPPVLIIVTDNTDIAEVFYRSISGEQVVEVVEAGEEAEDTENGEGAETETAKKQKNKTRLAYGQGRVFPEYFSNQEGFSPTVRIDSKLLAQAESGDPTVSRQDAAEQLRQIVATVGRPGEPGEQVRCVVSVAMLNEGWDAHNVTHILGVRAFTSQLLCEQVVGRGLRRMDYTPAQDGGLLTAEYVDIYGVPFSLIPFKGRPSQKAEPDDKPKNHVRALPERAQYMMRFPVVEGYVFALKRNLITADIPKMETLAIEPAQEPTAVFVKPRVGYQVGAPTLAGPGEFVEQDRSAYYASTHLQTIEFEIARQIVQNMVGDFKQQILPDENSNPRLRLQSRHQLFPQVLRLVHAYVKRKVNFHGANPCELGQQIYFQKVVERLMAAIRPDESQGEPPLMPLLNRYAPIGSTDGVDFKTTRPVFMTHYSHVNAVAADTQTWEQSAAFRLEQSVLHGLVNCYVRNEGMAFSIPYEFMGISQHYEPDYVVRLSNNVTLVLEIKGFEDAQDQAKHEAARRWVTAVNNWGKLGKWGFHLNRDPQMLERELRWLVTR